MKRSNYNCNLCLAQLQHIPPYPFADLTLAHCGPMGAERTILRACECPGDSDIHICIDCEAALKRFFERRGMPNP